MTCDNDRDNGVARPLHNRMEAAEMALEAALLSLGKSRQSLERRITSRAATAPAAQLLRIKGVKLDEVSAYYDSSTAAVVYKKYKKKSSSKGSSKSVVTFDTSSSSSFSYPSTINANVRIIAEENQEDPVYIEFLAFLNSMPDIVCPEKQGKHREKLDLAQKIVCASQPSNTDDLFEIPEEAVSDFADEDVSNRTSSFPSSLCNRVVVQASNPCDIHAFDGVYHKFDQKDGVNCYCKIGFCEGKETMFYISRRKVNNGLKKWYITGMHPERKRVGKNGMAMSFFYAYSNEDMPPIDGWVKCTEGRELFLWPAYVPKSCSRCNCFGYPSPISIQREWRRSTSHSLSLKSKKFNVSRTL